MFDNLRLWWRKKLLRNAVDSYFYTLLEIDEWERRFYVENEDDRFKQEQNLARLNHNLRECICTILYTLDLPRETWITMGDNRECMVTSSGYDNTLKVREVNANKEE